MELSGQASQVTAQGIGQAKSSRRFSFWGKGGTLFGIYIINLFLIIVTLGIYYFWAKVRVRTYLWGQTEVDGDRLSYHGTGQESLLGWLKALFLFIVPVFLLQNLPLWTGMPILGIVTGLLTVIIIYLFIPFAMVGTRRYRLSRTALRGIRFSFRGKWRDFAGIFIGGSLLMSATFGLYYPFYKVRVSQFMIENSWFGNKKFAFSGKRADLFGRFVVGVLLAVPTLFLSLIWFNYRKTKYIWEHTVFEGASFRTDITFGGVLLLYLTNLLILVFTLGFGLPWVMARTMRYYISNLRLEGAVDLDAIIQESQDSTALGEELGGFWDVGFDLG